MWEFAYPRKGTSGHSSKPINTRHLPKTPLYQKNRSRGPVASCTDAAHTANTPKKESQQRAKSTENASRKVWRPDREPHRPRNGASIAALHRNASPTAQRQAQQAHVAKGSGKHTSQNHTALPATSPAQPRTLQAPRRRVSAASKLLPTDVHDTALAGAQPPLSSLKLQLP